MDKFCNVHDYKCKFWVVASHNTSAYNTLLYCTVLWIMDIQAVTLFPFLYLQAPPY